MKLTVGPLPAAVYWRRRAVVLGGILLVVVLLAYGFRVSDSSDNESSGGEGGRDSKTHLYPTESTSESPPPDDGTGPGSAGGPAHGTGTDADPSPTAASGTDADIPACADDDLRVEPRPERSRTFEGDRLRIDLVITNVSEVSCERDVGADQQEVKVMDDDRRIWSSNDCRPQDGSEMAVLQPDVPVERFWVTWDGRTSAPDCEGERKTVPPGRYEVLAGLGSLTSKGVAVTVVAAG